MTEDEKLKFANYLWDCFVENYRVSSKAVKVKNIIGGESALKEMFLSVFNYKADHK